ncbi:hypothetical protein [Actinomyces sp. ZJ308]|uniref:hypothetical protein n=1 Tax=Actinomyces sp. ZJ308 TaxID=2708342 RepID=UPI00141F7ECF|nr:hypothetical protein [Actinomyces sp. ZJ308]
MGEQVKSPEESATSALDGLASRWAAWLRRTDSLEMVVEIEALGERVACANRVLRKTGLRRRLEWVEGGVPDELVHDAVALRDSTTRADGAAWTWAFLSISTRDGELTTDFDYERRPDLVPPCTRDDCAAELRLFPRELDRLPAWMAGLRSDDARDAVPPTGSGGDEDAGSRRLVGRPALQLR